MIESAVGSPSAVLGYGRRQTPCPLRWVTSITYKFLHHLECHQSIQQRRDCSQRTKPLLRPRRRPLQSCQLSSSSAPRTYTSVAWHCPRATIYLGSAVCPVSAVSCFTGRMQAAARSVPPCQHLQLHIRALPHTFAWFVAHTLHLASHKSCSCNTPRLQPTGVSCKAATSTHCITRLQSCITALHCTTHGKLTQHQFDSA